jgi:methyl-accepting chemotaxis protein
MTILSKATSWPARTADRIVLLLVLANGLASGWLWSTQDAASGALALIGGLMALATAAVWGRPGAMPTRWTLVASLGLFSVLQQFGGAQPAHLPLNMLVNLGVLLVYRDWRPVAGLGVWSVLQLTALDMLLQTLAVTSTPAASSAWPGVSLPVVLVTLHTAVMGILAVQQHHQARASNELEFLVKTMGREGKILLNLDVIRAETSIGQRLQHVQQRMLDAMGAVQEAALHLDQSAQRVASSSHELMARTEATASGLRDAVMCLDQINVIVQHSTDASNQAKQMSGAATDIADRGGQMVNDVIQTMQNIQTSSGRIHDIVGVIDGIAFQTNILALNAAVEAARAGEHGRGFAVVANEVRGLASRSAAAAREIRDLIKASTQTVASGAEQVAAAGATMQELVASVRRVGELFEEVTSDTSAHMQSLEMVSQSMADLDVITRQNVKLAEQTDLAASDLQSLAGRLAQVLNAFHVPSIAQGPASAPLPSPAARAPHGPRLSAKATAGVPAATATFF